MAAGAQARSAAAWEGAAVPEAEYTEIARALASEESPVGIDARHTHVLILHALDRIEKRLARLEEEVQRLALAAVREVGRA